MSPMCSQLGPSMLWRLLLKPSIYWSVLPQPPYRAAIKLLTCDFMIKSFNNWSVALLLFPFLSFLNLSSTHHFWCVLGHLLLPCSLESDYVRHWQKLDSSSQLLFQSGFPSILIAFKKKKFVAHVSVFFSVIENSTVLNGFKESFVPPSDTLSYAPIILNFPLKKSHLISHSN